MGCLVYGSNSQNCEVEKPEGSDFWRAVLDAWTTHYTGTSLTGKSQHNAFDCLCFLNSCSCLWAVLFVPFCPVSRERVCDCDSAASFIWSSSLWDALLKMWWDSEMLFFICIKCQHKVQPISSDVLLQSKARERHSSAQDLSGGSGLKHSIILLASMELPCVCRWVIKLSLIIFLFVLEMPHPTKVYFFFCYSEVLLFCFILKHKFVLFRGFFHCWCLFFSCIILEGIFQAGKMAQVKLWKKFIYSRNLLSCLINNNQTCIL